MIAALSLVVVMALTSSLYWAISARARKNDALKRMLKNLPTDDEQERERDEEVELLRDESRHRDVIATLKQENAEADLRRRE